MRIRRAEAADAALLDRALRQLSGDLGDPHRAGLADLRRAGFGASPVFLAMLAEKDGVLGGAVLASPLFSTTRGGAGLYVSDLWVAAEGRGQRLGARLLAAARDEGARLWQARFLRLPVYRDNARAMAFYQRLGFRVLEEERMVVLEGAALGRFGDDG